MSTCRWFLMGMTLLLGACGGKLQPNLELHGYWRVEHGFDANCQVTATFYENQILILSFYSLTDGACQPEHYGIRGDAVALDITSKKDYFDGEGALATELQVRIHDIWLKATLRLTETATGLRAVMVAAENDAMGLLDPLLNADFSLAAAATHWFQPLRGMWGIGCDPAGPGTCQVLEFRSEMIGETRVYRNCSAELECTGGDFPNEFFYVVRNIETLTEGKYKIDIATFGARSDDTPEALSATLIVSSDQLELAGYETYARLTKSPVVP
jgi:hypothetical protein